MDALAALRTWAYETSFPGVYGPNPEVEHIFRIPPHPAAEWLIATLEEGYLSYLPGMLEGDDRDILLEAIEMGDVTANQLIDENRAALTQIAGWPWFSAARLISLMNQSWETTGALLALEGVDPQKVPLSTFLGALYALYWRDASKEDRQKLRVWVATPLPEAGTVNGEWDEDAATEAVWAALKQQGHNISG